MFIFLALGVKEEDIITDYMITKPLRKKRNNLKYHQYRKLIDKKDYLDYLMAMIDTRPSYLEAALQQIKKTYTSSEDYLNKYFGLNNETIKIMRSFYLE